MMSTALAMSDSPSNKRPMVENSASRGLVSRTNMRKKTIALMVSLTSVMRLDSFFSRSSSWNCRWR
jgi:hypothetical protein